MNQTGSPAEDDLEEKIHASVQDLDHIDREILSALSVDARNTSGPDIAERVDVTPGTIRNRLENLVSSGIIEAHRSDIDYKRLGLLQVLFVCSVKPTRFGDVSDLVAAYPEVIETRELLNGSHNFHAIAVVGAQDQAEAVERRLTDSGLEIESISLVRDEQRTPSTVFGEWEGSDTDTE